MANQKSGLGKVTFYMAIGALVGGAVTLMNRDTRNSLKEKSSSTKDSVSSYVSTVKEDPQGTKDDLVDRIQRTATATKEAVNQIQSIINDQGKDLAKQMQDVKEESEEIVSTVKETGEELKDVGEKAAEAKEELTNSYEEEEEQTAPTTSTIQTPQSTDNRAL